MSFSTGNFIGNGSDATNDTSLTLTTTADIPAGSCAVIGISADNTTTSDGASTDVTTVTDSSGAVSWTKLGEYTNGEGAAGAGDTVALFLRPRQGSALTTGSVIDVTFGTAVTDKCCSAWEFPCGVTPTLATAAVGLARDASTDFGSLAFSSLPSKEYLFFRIGGMEANVASASQITPSTGFTAIPAVRSRNNAAAVLMRGEFRIVTATGETSNPTFAFSGDSASLFVALEEVSTPIAVKSSGYHQRGLR